MSRQCDLTLLIRGGRMADMAASGIGKVKIGIAVNQESVVSQRPVVT